MNNLTLNPRKYSPYRPANKKRPEPVIEQYSDNSKVTKKEGAKLILKGASTKVKDILLSVVKHPVATIMCAGSMSLLISFAPLLGISSAAAAGAFGLGFAGVSLYNLIKSIKKAVGDSKNNDNQKLREDLKEIGSAGVDAAISMNPKILKSNFNSIKYQAKYGKIAPRKEFISELKNAKGIKSKLNSVEYFNQKVASEINYYAGIDELQKELGFSDKIKKKYFDLFKIDDKEEFLTQAYQRLTEDLKYKRDGVNYAPNLIFDNIKKGPATATYSSDDNAITIYLKNEFFGGDLTKELKRESLCVLRHELQHFQQVVNIQRAEGLGGINALELAKKAKMCESAKDALISGMDEKCAELFKKPDYTLMSETNTVCKNNRIYSNGDKTFVLVDGRERRRYYDNIIKLAKKQGKIKYPSTAHKRAKTHFKNWLNYADMSDVTPKTPLEKILYFVQYLKYLFNPLEMDAYAKEGVLEPVAGMITTGIALNARELIPANRLIKKDKSKNR